MNDKGFLLAEVLLALALLGLAAVTLIGGLERSLNVAERLRDDRQVIKAMENLLQEKDLIGKKDIALLDDHRTLNWDNRSFDIRLEEKGRNKGIPGLALATLQAGEAGRGPFVTWPVMLAGSLEIK